MSTPPAPVRYGKVKGWYIDFVGDGNDPDKLPDSLPLKGSIKLTATAKTIKIPTAVPDPATAGVAPITLTLDAEGYVTLNSDRDINLIAQGPEVIPSDFQYLVEPSLRRQDGTLVQMDPFRIAVPPWDPTADGGKGNAVDLTTAAPTSVSGGVQTISVPGPVGITWRGAWTSGTTYAPRDGVSFGGSSYVAIAASTGSQPPSSAWALLAQKGDKGDPGTGTSGGGYSPPAGGIPKADLAAPVQTSLDKADAAAPATALALTDTKAGDAGAAAAAAQGAAAQALADALLAQDGVNNLIDQLDQYALLTSPTFNGAPKAPTPPLDASDTRLATAAFVQQLILKVVTAFVGLGGVAWDKTANSGAGAWMTTVRPSAAIVIWVSTSDPAAPRPTAMAVGDIWIRHPDAVG